MGVFPFFIGQDEQRIGLPHMRGGVSQEMEAVQADNLSSPHAWGCFRLAVYYAAEEAVFPTCVGVFLSTPLVVSPRVCLPHMRGGVSS